jgi:hypothetical protein
MCERAEEFFDVQNSVRRKARKEHPCCACSETIAVGHIYMRTFVVFDGRSDTYKHCLRCWKMLEALRESLPGDTAIAWELNCGEDWRNTIGVLPDDVAALAFMTQSDAQVLAVKA